MYSASIWKYLIKTNSLALRLAWPEIKTSALLKINTSCASIISMEINDGFAINTGESIKNCHSLAWPYPAGDSAQGELH